MRIYQVIKRPLVTEKGSGLQQVVNQYLFAVDPKATKHDVRAAVEAIFKVHVVDVNTMNTHSKLRRVGKTSGLLPAWKKAIVTLKEGDRIEFLEGT